MCNFEKAWVGKCTNPGIMSADGRCEDHTGKVCCSCGAPATKECNHTGIQFVCGSYLCDGCEHGPVDPENPGIFNLGGGHRKKPRTLQIEDVFETRVQ
jgi:hypothetical protein